MEVIDKIDQDIGAINKHWSNPETLSALLLRLSLHLETLGSLVVEWEDKADRADIFYKHSVDIRKLDIVQNETKNDKPVAFGIAESMAKIEAKEALDDFLTSKHQYHVLRSKRESVERIIDALRSRLSLIKTDIRNS